MLGLICWAIELGWFWMLMLLFVDHVGVAFVGCLGC